MKYASIVRMSNDPPTLFIVGGRLDKEFAGQGVKIIASKIYVDFDERPLEPGQNAYAKPYEVFDTFGDALHFAVSQIFWPLEKA